MNKTLRAFLIVIYVLAFALSTPATALAQPDAAETAAKTVRIESKKDNDGDQDIDEPDAGPAERSKDDEQNHIETEDGRSEKSKAAPVERMDVSDMVELHISSYEDWCDFAKRCTLDTWSEDKHVILDDDIDFNMREFEPVPIFGGVFEGNNHTINKAAYIREQNYIGIFSKTAPTAIIKDLNVIGVMKPEGRTFDIGGIVAENSGMIVNCRYEGYVEGYDYIGGISGYNDATGIISGCSVTGKITGLHHVGGICGSNAGLVTECISKADVNTVTKEVETSISDIKVEEVFTSLINRGREEGNKMSIRSSNNPVDIGGIAGHSTGEISSCESDSSVGYEHVGYNVGGIVGRQSGYVHNCTNTGSVQGRKDVGGITGQAEPYIRLDLNSDVISQISNAINELHDSVEVTIKDTDGSAGVVSARLNVIKSFADKALGDTGYLANSTTDFVNGVVGSTNEIVSRVEYVIDETGAEDGPLNDIAKAGEDLRDAASSVEELADDLDIDNYLDDDEKSKYKTAKKDLKNNTDEFKGYYDKKYNEVYPDQYDRKYYELLTGVIPDHRPTKDEIKEAEEQHPEKVKQSQIEAKAFAAEEAGVAATHEAEDKYKTAHGREYIDDVRDNTVTIATTILDHADEMGEDAKEDIKDGVSDVKRMAGDLRDAGKSIRSIVKSVADMDPVRFPQLSEEYKLHTNSLVANIQGMSDNLGFLNSEMKGSTDTVCADLEGVNDKFSSLMLLFTDAMDGALDMDYSEVFEDESNDVCEDSVDATIADCSNRGKVYGDINSGGIAGTMAEEYDFDLEGDITGVKDATRKSTYRTKCVLRGDENRAAIKGKKSYVGGICGLHEIGTILRCANYSKVSSESADYVGGIAGRSYSTIRNSKEKGVLAGQSYIGGIAGSCVDVTDCVAMPTVTEGTNFKGAIAGTADDDGKLKGNVFVSDELAGIDRISRSGAAEPVSYDQLIAMDDIPADFSKINVDFIVDGKVVASVTKKEGDVVEPGETPIEADIATKGEKNNTSGSDDKLVLADDEYIDWDCDKEIPVHEDMEINGEVTRYVSSIASEQVRDNRQSIFLVDGRFIKGEAMTVESIPAMGGTEEYVIEIPSDGASSHCFRYQMAKDVAQVSVAVDSGNGFEDVKTEMFGKYVTFEAPGNKVNVRITEKIETDKKKLYIIIGCIVFVLIVILEIINIIIKRIRRRHAAFKERIMNPPAKEKKAETKKEEVKKERNKHNEEKH